jgi:hypothetical protein
MPDPIAVAEADDAQWSRNARTTTQAIESPQAAMNTILPARVDTVAATTAETAAMSAVATTPRRQTRENDPWR